MSASKRGHLVVFEGLDRAGKSTQCAQLIKNLENQGRRVKHIRFPNRSTPIGKMIDAYLKGDSAQEDHVIHLLFSANRWEAAAEIEAAISSGIDIVVDRYYYSGCVYSAAKQNPTLDLRWARAPEEGLPSPDICLFLDISAEDAAKRGGYGAERYERKGMQDRVRLLFGELAASKDGRNFKVVNGGTSMDELSMTILKAVQDVFAEVDSHNIPLRHVEA